MRVCSPQLGLSPQATLGGEVYDREVLTGLARLGVEVDVILPAGLSAVQVANMSITRVPLSRGYRWFVSNPIFACYIYRAFRRHQFDLLRVHSLRFTGPAALVARRLCRLPVPIVAHHHHVEKDGRNRGVDRWVVSRCDLVITDSEFSRHQVIAEYRAPPERLRVVYPGVAPETKPGYRNHELADRLHLGGRRVLLYLGSLAPRKNVGVLLRSMSLICRERDDVTLLIAGEGPSEPSLLALARQLGIGSSVRFLGFVPEAVKPSYYSLADVFVTASLLEGFGLVVAEAMGCAKPIVASHAAALPELVSDGVTGILCDPVRPEAFAGAVLRLLDDATLAESMGRAGERRVRRFFRWDTAVRQIADLYDEVVQGWRVR